MQQYKKQLSKRIGLVRIISAIVVVVIIYFQFFYTGKPIVDGHIYSALFGGAAGVLLVEIYLMFQYERALRSEEALKKLYYEEHDERLALIRLKAGIPVMSIAGGVFLAAGFVSAYFQEVVAYTLFACGVGLFIYQGILKVYFSSKY